MTTEISSAQSIAEQLHGKRIRLVGLPGTGKTTRLLQLLDELLQTYRPAEIIYCSYSNAAVNEAVERVQAKFDIDENSMIYFRTMHSLCKRLLIQHSYPIGREPATPSHFGNVLYDLRSKIEVIDDFLRSVQLYIDTKFYVSSDEKADDLSTYSLVYRPGRFFMSLFAYMKTTFGCTPRDPTRFGKYSDKLFDRLDLRKRFHKRFITVIYLIEQYWEEYKLMNKLFEFDELLVKVHEYKVIPSAKILIVDEYQDSSMLQAKIVDLWSKHMDKTIVAGDPNQAIYGFNGASPTYLENFAHDQDILLHESWRVPQRVIAYCQQILSNTWTKQMTSATGQVGEVELTSLDQISFDTYSSVFILCRTSSIKQAVQELLQRLSVPTTSKRTPLVRSAYRLYYQYTTEDQVDLDLLVRLNTEIWDQSMPLFSAQTDTIVDRIRQGGDYNRVVSADMINTILDIKSASELVRNLYRSLPVSPRQQLRRLIDAAQPPQNVADLSQIKVMTMHAAKGLEAELVVLVRLGSWYEHQDQIDPDEERRVYFVAATRAKNKLVIVDMDHEHLQATRFLPDL